MRAFRVSLCRVLYVKKLLGPTKLRFFNVYAYGLTRSTLRAKQVRHN